MRRCPAPVGRRSSKRGRGNASWRRLKRRRRRVDRPGHRAGVRGARACSLRGSRRRIRSPPAGAPSARRRAAEHWFGTDEIGRDVFVAGGVGHAGVAAGGRRLGVDLAAAGRADRARWRAFVGGWVDALISRITDAFLACPFLILAIAHGRVPRAEPRQRDDRHRRVGHADLRAAHAGAGDGREGGRLRGGGEGGGQSAAGASRIRHVLPNVLGAGDRAGHARHRLSE